MAWADEVVKEGRGRVIRVDFSTDKFSTVSHRVSTVAGKLDGTNWYDDRIVNVGRLSRALGEDRIAAGAAFEMQLANGDGEFDEWFSTSNVETTWKLRCRLYLVLYDSSSSPSSFTAKQLGEFGVRRLRRNNSALAIECHDDMLANMSAGIEIPTFADWYGVGDSTNNPLRSISGFENISFPPGVDRDTPMQLLFGADWHEPVCGLVAAKWRGSAYSPANGQRVRQYFALPICATRQTGSFSNEIQRLRVDASPIGYGVLEIDISTGAFTTQRSPTITKNGESWKIIYVLLDLDALLQRLSQTFGLALLPSNQAPLTDFGNDGRDNLPSFWPGTDSETVLLRYFGIATRLNYHVRYGFFSGYNSSPIFYPLDITKDVLEYYTKDPPAVDTSAFALEQNVNGSRTASGRIGNGDSVRAALSKLGQSTDTDYFVNWSGEFSVSGNAWSEALAQELFSGVKTFPIIYEEEISGFEEWFPEPGERGAFANSYRLEGVKMPVGALAKPNEGPLIYTPPNSRGVSPSTRIIPGTIQMGWMPVAAQQQSPFLTRRLQFEVAPRIRFKTNLAALRLDLGDIFYLRWSRNVTPAAYVDDLFQVDAISWDPASDTVEVEALFRQDLSQQGYILDSQTMRLITSDASFAGDPSVEDGNDEVNFSAGNLTSAGVLAGDILVLLDATQGDHVFSRFRALRLLGVNTATNASFESQDLDFNAASPTAVTTWKILRGAVTAMTGSNYTSGDYYGKASDNSDNNGDDDAAQILDGG